MDIIPCAAFEDCTGELDLVVAADVLYDRQNLGWLGRFRQRAGRVLVADSRLRDFDEDGYARVARYESSTLPDLDEAREFRRVSVYASDGIGG